MILLWAGSSRAIWVGPSWISVDSVIASALVVSTARSVAVAAIWARGIDKGNDGDKKNNNESHF